MTIYDTTQLLSRGASLKLLADMLKQAEEEKHDLLEALKAATDALFEQACNMDSLEVTDAWTNGKAAIKRAEGIDPDYENAEAQREAN